MRSWDEYTERDLMDALAAREFGDGPAYEDEDVLEAVRTVGVPGEQSEFPIPEGAR